MAASPGQRSAPVAKMGARAAPIAEDAKSSPATFLGHSGDEDEDGPLFAEIVAALPTQRLRIGLVSKLREHMGALAAEEAPLSRPQRIRARDRAIREAIAEHYAGPPTCAAKALATALKRYADGGFRLGAQLSPDASAHRRALHTILTLNCGKPLGWRRIVEIF